MALFDIFKKEPPPPPKPWFKNVSIITPIVFAVIVGLMGIVWNGVAADLQNVERKIEEVEKEKATNADVKEALKELKSQTKEQNEAIQQNQIAIKELLIRQEVQIPANFSIKGGESRTTPVSDTTKKEANVKIEKKILNPEQFERYLSMRPEVKAKYKAYLEKRGYDVSDLPDE
jgi:hypothetical protein